MVRPSMDLGTSVVAVVLSTISAILAAVIVFVLTIVIGGIFIKGEMSYGFPLAVGSPSATITGVVVFVMVYRKIRSLAT